MVTRDLKFTLNLHRNYAQDPFYHQKQTKKHCLYTTKVNTLTTAIFQPAGAIEKGFDGYPLCGCEC